MFISALSFYTGTAALGAVAVKTVRGQSYRVIQNNVFFIKSPFYSFSRIALSTRKN